MRHQMSDAPTKTAQLARFFREHPNTRIDGRALAAIAGNYAWRTRVSECRTLLGMDIRNHQTRFEHEGQVYTVSEYEWVRP